MASFLETLSALTSSISGDDIAKSLSSAAGQAAGAAVTSGAAQVTSQITGAVSSTAGAVQGAAGAIQRAAEGAEQVETLATYYLVGTALLQALAAGAAVGIFMLQLKTYNQHYGARRVAANPRRQRRKNSWGYVRGTRDRLIRDKTAADHKRIIRDLRVALKAAPWERKAFFGTDDVDFLRRLLNEYEESLHVLES
jgi:hypothetical protein